jgi:hypothetical protein
MKGGVCLSETYTDIFVHLRWRCEDGHEWMAQPTSIRGGSWCPNCARAGSSFGERAARLILEAMFSTPFLKVRPVWLRRPGKRSSMELDGYAERLNVAFEYHGEQHYNPDKGRFNAAKVEAIRERDAIKRRLCWERGVVLVEIPRFTDNHDLNRCIAEVDFAVLRAGLKPPKRWKRPADLQSLRAPLERVFGASGVAEIRRIVSERGGELVSERADSAKERLQWRCSKGHEWLAVAYDVKAGSWCPVCARERRRGRAIGPAVICEPVSA